MSDSIAGVSLAYLGHRGSVVEKSQEKLRILRKGKSPIHVHGLGELLQDKTVQSNITFADDLDSVVQSSEIAVSQPSPGIH